jgi:hypothetical protein
MLMARLWECRWATAEQEKEGEPTGCRTQQSYWNALPPYAGKLRRPSMLLRSLLMSEPFCSSGASQDTTWGGLPQME